MTPQQSVKARLKVAEKMRKHPPGEFKPVDIPGKYQWMSRAYANNRYTVMIMDNAKTDKGIAIRAMIQAHDAQPIRNHWSEMQKIKNEIFGAETVAVEYYPAQSKLVDEYNVYWMWIFPEGVLPIPIA